MAKDFEGELLNPKTEAELLSQYRSLYGDWLRSDEARGAMLDKWMDGLQRKAQTLFGKSVRIVGDKFALAS